MVYIIREYNWHRVAGVFSTLELAEEYKKCIEQIEVNLMWEIFEFTINAPVPDDIAVCDRDEKHYFHHSQTNGVLSKKEILEMSRYDKLKGRI